MGVGTGVGNIEGLVVGDSDEGMVVGRWLGGADGLGEDGVCDGL